MNLFGSKEEGLKQRDTATVNKGLLQRTIRTRRRIDSSSEIKGVGIGVVRARERRSAMMARRYDCRRRGRACDGGWRTHRPQRIQHRSRWGFGFAAGRVLA